MLKTSTMKNVYIMWLYTRICTRICTKNMELLYSKEKTNSFCLIKLLFIKVRCLININVSLEAILEGQE